MANSSASGGATFCTCLVVLWIMDPLTHVCEIAVALLCLMLASVLMKVVWRDFLASSNALVRMPRCIATALESVLFTLQELIRKSIY